MFSCRLIWHCRQPSVFFALSALMSSFKIIYFQKVKCLLCYSPNKPRSKVSILIYHKLAYLSRVPDLIPWSASFWSMFNIHDHSPPAVTNRLLNLICFLMPELRRTRKFEVALNPMYRIYLNFAKSYILSCLSKFYKEKKIHRAVFEI